LICKFKYFDLTNKIMTEYINSKNRELIISNSMSKHDTRLRADRNKIGGIRMIVYAYVISSMILDMYATR